MSRRCPFNRENNQLELDIRHLPKAVILSNEKLMISETETSWLVLGVWPHQNFHSLQKKDRQKEEIE